MSAEKRSQEEMDDLWEKMRPYCPPEVTREAFDMCTRILESIETPEQAEAIARFISGARR